MELGDFSACLVLGDFEEHVKKMMLPRSRHTNAARMAAEQNNDSAKQMRDRLADQLDPPQRKEAAKILEELKRHAGNK